MLISQVAPLRRGVPLGRAGHHSIGLWVGALQPLPALWSLEHGMCREFSSSEGELHLVLWSSWALGKFKKGELIHHLGTQEHRKAYCTDPALVLLPEYTHMQTMNPSSGSQIVVWASLGIPEAPFKESMMSNFCFS